MQSHGIALRRWISWHRRELTLATALILAAALFVLVAPGLLALDTAHSARFLGGRRLYEAAAALGLRPAPAGEDDLNPEPHPFP